MASKLSVQPSRFALLKIEDSEDETDSKSEKSQKSNQNQATAKKKNKKKKKGDGQGDSAMLKHLAFGQPVSKGKQSSTGGKCKVQGSGEQWEEWKKLDSEFAADTFEKDLQQALLSSKLEFEQTSQKLKNGSQDKSSNENGDDKRGKKKKKQKDKPAPMSLEQFKQMDTTQPKQTSSDEEESPPAPPPLQTRVPDTIADTKFFDKVKQDVDKIIVQEKMHERYKKQYAMESALVRNYENDKRKKEKEVTMLRATVKKLEDELKQVKQRNKQLCHILGQGEMRDMAEVLIQVEQLTNVKDELTEQVSELTGELEKEKTKVHTMKAELDRMKGGKHGGR